MIRLVSITEEAFDRVYDKMVTAFPYEERRDRSDQKDCIGKEYFSFLEIFDDNSPVGFISLWSFPEFLYIEHFAIDVNCRSHGYGSLVLQKIKDEYKKPVILEAEIPLTTEQIKRIVFYDRNGFKVNSFPYIQPSYHGGEGVPLNILSFPRLLTDEEYNTFLRHTRKNVYCTD